jgi:hypothetical protein
MQDPMGTSNSLVKVTQRSRLLNCEISRSPGGECEVLESPGMYSLVVKETSVNINLTTWQYIPEVSKLHTIKLYLA